MLITIAIPTYNNEDTIAIAIKSALDQDYENDYEILIVNNASKDGTQGVIESFKDDKIRIVVNKETYDMYTNHNICLEEAKGDYILYCHSDDELMPNALTLLSNRIKERKYPARYILWGHSLFRDFNTSIIRLTPSGTCYSRKPLLEIGGFPSSNSKAPEMDWVVMVLAAFNCFEFEMLDRIYFKRKDASTAVRGMTNKEIIEIHKDALDKMFSRMSEEQMSFFINQLISSPSLDMLSSVKGYISKKTYIKRCIKISLGKLLY